MSLRLLNIFQGLLIFREGKKKTEKSSLREKKRVDPGAVCSRKQVERKVNTQSWS